LMKGRFGEGGKGNLANFKGKKAPPFKKEGRLKATIENAKRFNEKNWKVSIDVKDEFEELGSKEELDKGLVKKLVGKILSFKSKIKQAGLDAEDFADKVDELSNQDTIEEFDYAWQDLYDWADENDVWLGAI